MVNVNDLRSESEFLFLARVYLNLAADFVRLTRSAEKTKKVIAETFPRLLRGLTGWKGARKEDRKMGC